MIGALRIQTKALALAADTDTEMEIDGEVREFQLQARDATVIQVAFDSGQVGAGGRYWTIKAGTVFQSGRIVPLTSGKPRKIYLRAAGITTAELVLVS